jgi:uncharacterized protein
MVEPGGGIAVREAVGSVAALWRFPVKSMPGERLDTAEVTERGVVGDRSYALIEVATGKVVSGKNPKLGPAMLGCRAEFTESPREGEQPPPVRITLPDGTSSTSDAPDVDATLSGYLGRGVTLARAAPEDFTIDQYHPDQEDLDPEGHRDEVAETSLGSAFFNERGLPSAVPEGSFFDVFPISLLTTSTLEHLNDLQPQSRFDARRFRMNLIVDTPASGFVENSWLGRALDVGGQVRLDVVIPDPRCVMPNLAQEDLPRDPNILKTLAQHNRLDVAGGGLYPCAGVYAVAGATGAIHKGDGVRLA